MHNFKELNVWKASKDFCVKMYKNVANFPASETYGITSQLKRASVSIPSNIAEGAGRSTKKDFARFISIAMGSSFEVETQLIISKELEFLSKEKYDALITDLNLVQKQLVNFQKHLYK